MNKNITYMSAALLLFGGSVSAQEKLTLDAYQQKVVEYSQQLKQAKEQVLSATAKRKADKTGFLPKIDLAGYGAIDFTNLDLWNSPLGTYHPYNYFAGATLTQSIWAGGAVQNQYRSDKISEQISKENELLTLDNIYLQADQVYWNASANTTLLEIARQYRELINSQYEIIKVRFDDGAIAKNDLLMITTRLKETELGVKKAEVSYLVAYQNLNILMGMNPNEGKEPVADILTPMPSPQEISFEEALGRRPEYKVADMQVNLAQENRKLALSKFNPNIAFQTQGGWGTSNPNLGANPTWTAIGTLSLSMPIWHWGERKQVNRQFRALQNSALYNKQIVSDQINKEVANAWTTMDQNFEQIRVAEENLKLAQEALDLNTYSYNEGKITIADVLSSQISWIQAYTNMITAHYSYKVAVAQYKKAVGMIVPGSAQ
ncbi:MAG: TolC family protein [Bacteroidales bacterium]